MNQQQQLTVKSNRYLFSHFPTRRKDSSISKVLMMLEKGNSDPDLSPGAQNFVLSNQCTHGVFCPSVHKGEEKHSLSAYFSSLSLCYSSIKIMIMARMLNTIPPEHIKHLSLQLFTHFVPPS